LEVPTSISVTVAVCANLVVRLRNVNKQRKRERREVYSVHPTVLSYLDWSEETISFDREDHPDHIPNLG
jgi:hypothetical protein